MAKKKKKPAGWKGHVFLIVALLSSVMFSAIMIIFVIGMIPTLVAGVVDKTHGRIRCLTVGAMNFAGCAPFMIEVFKKGNDVSTAIAYMVQPRTIVVIYFAAAMGYLIDWAMTGIVSSIMVQRARGKLKNMEKQKKELVERWGPEVTGTMPLDEFGFAVGEMGTIAGESTVKS
ncbi:MAG: hypothetical protein DI626_09675 [Micavibrio aeruginosavorus]|uniref:Uncharacterized protein n=1 Tax=Micavibrio aeruginosavorus TaxID=349221 RepID=A0A2W4ZQ17_9BACT|nr:MAG: hypothetical protein DI626_09675 [Micavibrio aeruginosavorus]